MNENEKLDLILSEMLGMKSDMQDMKLEMQDLKTDMQDTKSEMQDLKTDMQDMKLEMQDLKTDMQGMKLEMQDLKTDMQDMKSEMQDLRQKVVGTSLHIENVTDKNIQLIAENFIELTKKLNQAIPAADKNLAYEVKVNYLIERVEKLEEEVAELKNRTA